jgi:enterochelin esterase-like enzyme
MMKLTQVAGLASAFLSTQVFAQNRFPTMLLNEDVPMNFQMLTSLGIAITGGADINPILGIAQDIIPGNRSSFSEQFARLAYATKAIAEDPELAYDEVTVRDTWFSVANYFRNADTYNREDWNDPRINEFWDEQTAAFDKAISALPVPGERIRIPAAQGNFTIEAIWYGGSKKEGEKLPTLIVGNGFDAAQEDSYHNYVAPALLRGWNAITYEGPGQPTVRRNSNAGFIAAWETVLNPVVDWVLAEKAGLVDETRLALVGNSLGGYFAARAAAFEPRLAATVLVGGVWNASTAMTAQYPPEILALYEAGDYAGFDEAALALMASGELGTQPQWMLEHSLWAFNTHSPSQVLLTGEAFHVEDFIQQIEHPVFVGDAELENYYAGQAQLVADALGERATFHMFNGTAGYHCQTGAGQELSRTMFAWLQRTLYL